MDGNPLGTGLSRWRTADAGTNLSASSWPGKSAKRVLRAFAQMSLPSTSLQTARKQDVDARHKAGHDE
jgi:hypothetical protein